MIYKQVSKIKEQLSAIGIGCWNFGGDWDSSDDRNTENIVLTALDEGINFFDIAPVYGFYHSEEILGKLLKKHGFRNKIILASKCGLRWGNNHVTYNDLSKDSILWEVDQSLKRLNTDHLDIYQLHWPDPDTNIEETADTLCLLKRQGKIRYVGLSNFSQKQAEVFGSIIEVNSQQALYNMLERNPVQYHGIPLEYRTEKEILPYVKQMGQAFFPYSPLFQGLLCGTFKQENNFSGEDIRNANPNFSKPLFTRYYSAAQKLKTLANEIGRPLNEVALNWLRQKEEITSIIAGVDTPDELRDNLKCLEWELTDEMLVKIEKIIKPFAEEE